MKRKMSGDQKEKNHCWYLTTVGKSGSKPVTKAYNLLSKVENPIRGAVLPKPFPGTVTQGVILVFVIVNNQLKVLSWVCPLKSPR
jgi:hypothetical protein